MVQHQADVSKSWLIQYQALKLCTDAFITTPTAALQVEMGEKPRDDTVSIELLG